MSDAALAAQSKRIEELTAQVAQLNAESKTRRIEGKKKDARIAELTGQLGTVTTERDTLKTKAQSTPTEQTAKITELEGKLLSRDHGDAFKGVKTFKVKGKDDKGADVETEYQLRDGVSVQDVWDAIKYKAEGETPDAAKVHAALSQAHATKGFLFEPRPVETTTAAPGGAPTAIKTGAATAGPGASRSLQSHQQPPSARDQIDAGFAATKRDRPGRIA